MDMYNDNMETARPILPVRWMQVLCILAGIYAVAVASSIFVEMVKPGGKGGTDFHQFWYAGHFIIQGRDPYEAFFAGEEPSLPVVYLDGVTVTQSPVAQPEMEIAPVNLPIMLLLLTPFSYFSWPIAKWAFLVVDLILMLVTGWLVLRRIPFADVKLTRIDEVLIFLAYFDLSATRIAIENGQTTLLVFLLMLVALYYAKRSWGIAGLALGVALSKYSVSLPVFLFILYKKKFKILLLAIAVQILGVLGIAVTSGNSPFVIVYENIQLLFRLFDQPGVHLARWFEFLSDNHYVSMIPVLVLTFLIFVRLFLWLRGQTFTTSSMEDVLDFHLLTILFIWTILVAYHQIYDTLILLFFFVLVFKGLTFPNLWKLTNKGRMALLAFMGVLPLILILPARIVDILLPFYYGRISDAVITFLLVVMLTISMLLLRRSLQNIKTQPLN